MRSNQEETVEVPIAWFKRLLELSERAEDVDVEFKGLSNLNQLFGYISSARSIIDKYE